MITKYVFGHPFETEAIVIPLQASSGDIPAYIKMSLDNTSFTINLAKSDIVYGLGENMGGINKRGRIYVSNCTDDPHHTEDRTALYCAHNFFVVDGSKCFGVFIDFPSDVTYDIGFTDVDLMSVTIAEANYSMYVIEGTSSLDIIREFRNIIGRSYVAPLWAFGYQQSRWGYRNAEDVREVVNGYRSRHLPLDAVYLDIDYMDHYKDFTLDDKAFPDFAEFVKEMRAQNIHLVPIIDAGVKIEQGYDVYEEGVANDYFCKDADGKDFVAAVWPGRVHMPDFLNPATRLWFGRKYKILTDMGIDGFWNDMNEPALFYSDKSLREVFENIDKLKGKDLTLSDLWAFQGEVNSLANNPKDYASFYHETPVGKIRHDKVHNLYGYNMTRAAAEGFADFAPDKNILLFSRSSYIGMHRYGGMWTGDNSSWWSHIELLIHMLPGLNMCGFLYCGADTGGFGGNTSEELMMRFLQLSMFTPLMRNHSALGTREQELYQFKDIDAFRNMLELRYALIPYLYDTYTAAVDNNELMFTPLGMLFPHDEDARRIEDQLMVGADIMIAPIYQPNVSGRSVYLPEDMTLMRIRSVKDIDTEYLASGYHFVKAAINEVLIFVRKGHELKLGKVAESTEELYV